MLGQQRTRRSRIVVFCGRRNNVFRLLVSFRETAVVFTVGVTIGGTFYTRVVSSRIIARRHQEKTREANHEKTRRPSKGVEKRPPAADEQ